MIRIIIWALLILISPLLYGQTLSVYRSGRGMDETVGKLVELITSDDQLIFFETVSHDSIAKERGLELAPTRSILFEEPELTTQLINCQQTAALDLPLEIIVWEEYEDVYIGFMDPKFMRRRFMINGCDETLIGLASLMNKVVMDAIRQLK